MPDHDSPLEEPKPLEDADFVIEQISRPKPRRRKWLIAITAMAAAFAGLCFLGCVVFSFFCHTAHLTSPAEVLAPAQEITDFTLPPGYQGELAEIVDTPVFLVRKAVFRHETGKGVLLIAEMKLKILPDDDEALSRGLQQIAGDMRRVLSGEQAAQTLTIRGTEAEFTLTTGDDPLSTTKYREIRGEFPGKSGRALLWLQAEDSIWNDEDAHAFLESVH